MILTVTQTHTCTPFADLDCYYYYYIDYTYVIAAALSHTKGNRSLDDSVARGSISVMHGQSLRATPSHQRAALQIRVFHICIYKHTWQWNNKSLHSTMVYCSQTIPLCTCMPNKTVIQPNRFTNHIHNTQYTQCTHIVPISTSGILTHILTDCRGTGEGQTEEEEEDNK